MFVQIDDLPYELLETVLLKACRLMLHAEMRVRLPTYADVPSTLASVCGRFSEVISRRQFRHVFRRLLKGLLFLNVFVFLTISAGPNCHISS